MTTGYTAALCDGEQSFKEFVIHCACAFFYDTAALPPKWTPDSYYKDRVAEQKVELAEIEKMGMAEAEREAGKEYARIKREFDKSDREKVAMKGRLLAMRGKVADWAPPTNDHVALKKFMLEQIDSTIDFDTKSSDAFRPKRKTGGDWLREKIAALKGGIKDDEKHYEEEVKRAEQRNDWCDALRASLKGIK
jgi:hypothetical protein